MRKTALFLTAALAMACANKTSAPNARGGGPPSTTTVEDAAMAYASEACAREARCDRVGEGKQLSGPTACQSSFEHVAMQGLSVCDSRAVNPSLLVDCMNQIRSSSCDTTIEAACSYVELCGP